MLLKPPWSCLCCLLLLKATALTNVDDIVDIPFEFNTRPFSSQGCTKGPHNKEKPPEPVKPEVKSSGEKKDVDEQKPKFNEYIISAPKPQETIQRPR